MSVGVEDYCPTRQLKTHQLVNSIVILWNEQISRKSAMFPRALMSCQS